MTMVAAGITISLDGYVAGPNDGPGVGLGEGGERLHYWVFGGPWSYEDQPTAEATGADKEFLDEGISRGGAIIGGRSTYEAAERWGGSNPFGVPFFIVTHHPEDGLQDAGFSFVDGLEEAIARAREAAGEKDVFIMGGADLIRQALRAGHVEELSISIAPVVLGGGQGPVRRLRSAGGAGAGAGPAVTAGHAHHVPRAAVRTRPALTGRCRPSP